MSKMSIPPTGTLVFFVNGHKIEDDNVNPEWTLLYYLRQKLRLCGTKLGCAEGGCGACTVTVSKYDRERKQILHYAVNACLAPVAAMHGLSVTTVEGIGSVKTRLHPVQERIAKAHGSQCGFCTPGIVMSMYSLLRSSPKPTMDQIEVAFQGNLCRCTGYRPIIEGFKTFTEDWEQRRQPQVNGTCSMGANCCRNGMNGVNGENGVNGVNGTHETNGVNGIDEETDDKLFNPTKFTPHHPSQELIFPPELQINSAFDAQYLIIRGERTTWYRPLSLDELLRLKQEFPQAKIINGNSEVGVEVKFKNFHYPVLIQPSRIKEMTTVTDLDKGVKVGAAVTLSEMEDQLRNRINRLDETKTRVFKAIVNMLHYFAGRQIRNVGAVGGNIMTGSPISDLNPIFMAAHIELEVMSREKGRRTLTMDHTFWTGYRRNVVQPNEVLTSIVIPYSEENQYFKAYKQAKRRDDDIAIVNGAFNLTLDGTRIKTLHMAYGGMAPTTILAVKSCEKLIGREWNNETLEIAYNYLAEEIPLSPSAPGGSIQYRRSLTLSLLFKFFLEVIQTMETKGIKIIEIPENYRSGKDTFHSKPPKSSQYFSLSAQKKTDWVGRPIVHRSAYKQATGEAIYCDDIPKFENELFLSLVLSTKAHANILSVDATEALKMKGVVAFFSAKDIPESCNSWGPVIHDDEVFVSKKVTCQGQVIGAIVAEDQLIAQKANKLVKIEYEPLEPIIVSIEDAIKHNSFLLPKPKILRKGDLDLGFKNSDHVVQGEIKMGGQEHFYLETHACIAVPKGEDDEMEIIASTQHPSEIQHLVSHILGVPQNRIVCKAKRLGGGFGGKESRSALLAIPTAIAAHKLGRPVRVMLDRDEDMITTGQRHAFFGKYKVGFKNSGEITAVEVDIYNNGGCTRDLSESILERAMFHFNNSCYIPNVLVKGYICKTNIPSNTAFRGFGGPQGMFIGENIFTHVAHVLKKDVMEVRQRNMYKENNLTHFNQKLTYCTLDRCWNECINSCNFSERKEAVDAFNKMNRWRKRGITVVPTMFGIAFTTLFLNQAGALVLVYRDGTVLLSHGGIEMGQGLHTKMIQVASRALGVDGEKIHICETSTDKVPNTSATAASAGSDLNGMAVLNACAVINERLEPFKKANPKGKWEDWVNSAYFSRVSLAASGFYKTPDIGFNFNENSGQAFNYFTFGAACSEVEIDCLTGDHQVLRTDIVMDLGESLNPAIDIGQIEGGFIQGYGLFTMEELVVSPTGTYFSRGPGVYKIPGFADIPQEFNVTLLKDAPNPRAVYSSKAVGEPPLFLASSIFFAIREAVKNARLDSGDDSWFQFNSPATSAKIRMACKDQITAKFPDPPKDSFTPWNVEL